MVWCYLFLVLFLKRFYLEVFMFKRSRISKKKSGRSFTRGALRVNGRNTAAAPMRGGIRL